MKAITKCRACDSKNLTEFLDLGQQYLSDFRKDKQRPPKYPLVAVFCENCKLVQLKHTTPQTEMYHDNYGFKSGISNTIKRDLDDVVMHGFQYVNDPHYWLDIASNDGTLLSFVPRDVVRVGVDPVKFLCDEAEQYADAIINDYFSAELFSPTYTFDVITSISCFYDMPDPSKFVQDTVKLLAPHGVWIIQQNYLLTTMQLSAVDNFVHEHLEYYTLRSLENLLNRFGLEVNEVTVSDINGGSIRTIVSHTGTFDVDESVYKQRQIEAQYGVDDLEAYQDFAQHVGEELERLNILVRNLVEEGNSIAILAASTRGATIWQSADLDKRYIQYAIERNPAKVGKHFSAIDVPIISEEEAHKRKPDYVLIGPWFHAKEILEREKEMLSNGTKAIIPLPKVKVLN